MRPVLLTTGATGASAWVPIDYLQKAFGIGFRCTVGGGSSPDVTYKVQHAFSSLVQDTVVRITRSTTTATLTFNAATALNGIDAWVNHGLSVGDNVVVRGAGAPLDGTFAVASVTNSRVVTYTVANSGVTVAGPQASVERLYVGDHPVVTGATGSTDGNYAYPPNYIRTNITAYGAGSLTLSLNQGV
jgi:hypothetical protein